MTIFDVIKYPITIKYRADDLSNIPQKLLTEWWDLVLHYERNKPINPKIIFRHGRELEPITLSNYMNNHMAMESRKNHLNTLKELIRDMDEVFA